MAQQNLVSPHSGVRATITPGDPMSRAMGNYKVGHSYLDSIAPPADAIADAPGAGAIPVRGGKGGTRPHVRQGGLGAGPNGSYGSPRMYGVASDAG